MAVVFLACTNRRDMVLRRRESFSGVSARAALGGGVVATVGNGDGAVVTMFCCICVCFSASSFVILPSLPVPCTWVRLFSAIILAAAGEGWLVA